MIVSTLTNCEYCGGEVEITGDVNVYTQHHPYGSTTAAETLCEVYVDEAWCPECGADVDPDRAGDLLADAVE